MIQGAVNLPLESHQRGGDANEYIRSFDFNYLQQYVAFSIAYLHRQ